MFVLSAFIRMHLRPIAALGYNISKGDIDEAKTALSSELHRLVPSKSSSQKSRVAIK